MTTQLEVGASLYVFIGSLKTVIWDNMGSLIGALVPGDMRSVVNLYIHRMFTILIGPAQKRWKSRPKFQRYLTVYVYVCLPALCRNMNLSAFLHEETFATACLCVCVCVCSCVGGWETYCARCFSSICPPRGRSGGGEINWRKRMNQC